MWIRCTLAACGVIAASGMVGVLAAAAGLANRRAKWDQWLSTFLASSGSLLGIVAAAGAMLAGPVETIRIGSIFPEIPGYGAPVMQIRLDAVSGFFLVPIFLIGGAGSVYGLGYWKQSEHPANARRLRLCYGLLIAALAMVTLAGDGVLFLLAWEVMALSAFFLVVTEDDKPEARQAGWVYIVATHVGTLVLFAVFALWRTATGSWMLEPIATGTISLGLHAAIFFLALLGFGLKAGMWPLHFWLPGAHANAPSHVSAILSGVVLKIGIYGMVRMTMLLPAPPGSWGALVLMLGALSAVVGVVFALGQHDLKRLLAYHSIENIGIILMGLGVAMIGISAHRPAWVLLGMGGCLLHVWNHAIFKSLLFLAAGSVVHAVQSRQIDVTGGLGKRMPWTSAMFAVGAVAICGLPPLNGFVSELLVYLGLFNTAADGSAGGWSAAALASPALAMVGALAVACFVKAYGTVFLGEPRTDTAAHAHEAPVSMIGPMVVLATACIAIGVFPTLFIGVLDRTTRVWAGPAAQSEMLWNLAPHGVVTTLSLCLIAATAAVTMILLRRTRQIPLGRTGTWDCGYARPTPRMQYTSSSFAQMLVGLFRWLLKPSEHRRPPEGLYPAEAAFSSHVPDLVLDRVLHPLWAGFKTALKSLRFIQHGPVQRYILYTLLMLVLLLLSLAPIGSLFKWIAGG